MRSVIYIILTVVCWVLDVGLYIVGCDLGKCGSRCEQTCDCPNGCAEDTVSFILVSSCGTSSAYLTDIGVISTDIDPINLK